MSHSVRKLLQAMAQPQEIWDQCLKEPPRSVISTQDHTKGFEKAKEKMAAGMLGLHFGMCKAHIQRERQHLLTHLCAQWHMLQDIYTNEGKIDFMISY